MKQNCWTIKYRSLTYIYLVRSMYVSQWCIIPTMMFIHQIILKILSKITRSWNVGHVDLHLLWSQNLGHTVSSENMTLMHQIVLEIQDKVTGPWNIGHIDLHLFKNWLLIFFVSLRYEWENQRAHTKKCTSVFSFIPQGNEKKSTVSSYNLISYHFHIKSKGKQP